MTITVTRTNRATSRAFITHHPDAETARQFIEHSIYDHTKATRTMSRAMSNLIMGLGHEIHQTQTKMFLWTVRKR